MKKEYIIWILWFIIFILSLFIFPGLFNFIEIPYKPDFDPPWYFMLNDLKSGLSAVLAVILSGLLLAAFPFVERRTFRLFVFFTIIWYSFPIGNMISVILNTENLLDPEIASSNWATHEEYIKSTWRKYLFYIYLVIVVAIFLVLDKKDSKGGASS